tara:strand:+ start:236 stop:1150 length:915 start_codon:yes stop_codon:yes gene_type:complete
MLFYFSIIFGIILLSFGGDYLVRGSSGLARKLKISPMIIGIVIIGFGTSVPEIFVASNAVINNASDIALGSVVGSNIANILLVFSFALIISKDSILKVISIGDMLVMQVVTLLLSVLLIIGSIEIPISFVMILFLPTYFYFSYSFFNKNIDIDEVNTEDNYLKLSITILIGFSLLFIGSDIFIKGLKDFAEYYNIPESVLGLTLAAIGTSLPELAVTFASVKNKAERVLLGNILGSNIINVLGALGISSLFGAITVPENFSFLSLYYLIFSAFWLYLLTKIQIKKIYLGLFGLVLYLIYVISLY